MNKQDKLLVYCKSFERPFSSVEIKMWGLSNFFSSAYRRVQEFVGDPNKKIRRISTKESILRGLVKPGNARLAFFEVTT